MHIRDRGQLLEEYSKVAAEPLADFPLEPSHCASVRDAAFFAANPFAPAFESQPHQLSVKILSDAGLVWVPGAPARKIAKLLEIGDVEILDPCPKRAALVERALAPVSSCFPQELRFIADFTSCLIWMKPTLDSYLGSASFSEVPHCTLFSDGALLTVPPFSILPKPLMALGIIENLYHEALHHQMHSVRAFSKADYLMDKEAAAQSITIDWRERGFLLVEALHALHVYSLVTPLRLKWRRYMEDAHFRGALASENHDQNVEIIDQCVREGARMWSELESSLMDAINFFTPFWRRKIMSWSMDGLADRRFL